MPRSRSQSQRDDFTLKNGSKRVLFCPTGVNNEKPTNSNSLDTILSIYLSISSSLNSYLLPLLTQTLPLSPEADF
eukprot:scaffold71812_cov37-Cyclotella_meneghiniana.AAC.1